MTKSKSKYIFIPLFLVVLILTLIISLIPKATNKVYASSADNVETVYNFYGSNFSSYIDCGNTAPVAVNFKITLTQSGSGFFCTPSLAFDNYLVSWSSNNAYQDSILNPKDSAFHTYTGFTYLNGIFMDNLDVLISLYCDTYFNCNVVRIMFGSSNDSRWDLGYDYYNYIRYIDNIGNQFIMTWKLPDKTTSFMFDQRDYYINNPNIYTENENYQFGYSAGYGDGYYTGNSEGLDAGYKDGYKNGELVGYQSGFNDGVNDSNQYTFMSLFGAVLDAPVSVFTSLFNFNILGINLFSLITGLFTLCVIIVIIKMCLGGK